MTTQRKKSRSLGRDGVRHLTIAEAVRGGEMRWAFEDFPGEWVAGWCSGPYDLNGNIRRDWKNIYHGEDGIEAERAAKAALTEGGEAFTVCVPKDFQTGLEKFTEGLMDGVWIKQGRWQHGVKVLDLQDTRPNHLKGRAPVCGVGGGWER